MFGLGFQEVIVLGVVAVVLFGKRLPEVAKSLGASYRDFRRGLSEIQSQIDLSDTSSYTGARYSPPSSVASTTRADDYDDRDEPTAPKFELPAPAKPSSESERNSLD
jgi:sec-independent protein translocase protein TatA